MKIKQHSGFSDIFLDWGIVILAVSLPLFSHTIMYFAFGMLFISFIVKLASSDIQVKGTGLELPLGVFLALYFTAYVAGGYGIKNTLENCWHVLYMYAVIFLFGEREVLKFTRILGWAALIISVYTILQSLIGLSFNLEFTIGEWARMSPPRLEKIAGISGYEIYRGVGIVGRWQNFTIQLLMLFFIQAAAFRKKWAAGFAGAALLLTFYYPAWLAAALGYSFYFVLRKRYYIAAAGTAALSLVIFFISGGAGYFDYRSSLAGDMLVRPGGLAVLAAFLFFLFRFIKLYGSTEYSTKENWKKLQNYSWCALFAAAALSFFKNGFNHPANSVFIWVMAGLIIKIKLSRWSRRLIMLREEV